MRGQPHSQSKAIDQSISAFLSSAPSLKIARGTTKSSLNRHSILTNQNATCTNNSQYDTYKFKFSILSAHSAKGKVTRMAATTTMRSRWAQYDDELEDSDQTISAFRRAASASSHSRRSAVGSAPLLPPQPPLSASFVARKKLPVKSAFFVETTDEEEISAHGAPVFGDNMRARNTTSRSSGQRRYAPLTAQAVGTTQALVLSSAPQPSFPLQHARLHIGEIQFPVTRSVLWYVVCAFCDRECRYVYGVYATKHLWTTLLRTGIDACWQTRSASQSSRFCHSLLWLRVC